MGATRRATSACRTTATAWPSATSRSGCCRDQDQALGHDVPPVFRLGRLVRDDGDVPDTDAALLGAAGGPGVWRHGDRSAGLAFLHGDRRRPVLRQREAARAAAPRGWGGDVVCLDPDDLRDVLPRP